MGNEYVDCFGGPAPALLGSFPSRGRRGGARAARSIGNSLRVDATSSPRRAAGPSWCATLILSCREGRAIGTASGTDPGLAPLGRLSAWRDAHTGGMQDHCASSAISAAGGRRIAGAGCHVELRVPWPGVAQRGVTDLSIMPLSPTDDVGARCRGAPAEWTSRDDIAVVMFRPSGASWTRCRCRRASSRRSATTSRQTRHASC